MRGARRFFMLLLGGAVPAVAQGLPAVVIPAAGPAASGARADENAVRQAGDAFGTSIGREVIGLYNQMSVRGFSPVAAGNVRIDGLYFDPVIVPTPRLARATTIRVGLSALGNPFPAPTGLVDFGFRRPGDTAAASVQVGIDSWGTVNAELDAVLPVATTLSLGLGAFTRVESGLDRTRDHKIGGALIARWTPAPGLTLMPFVNVTRTLLDDHRVTFLTATEVLPQPLPRRQRFGPDWIAGTNTEANLGLIGDWQLAPQWLLRAGLFRSSRIVDDQYSNLVRDLRPDGSGRQLAFADPQLAFVSVSGELRLTRTIADGPRQHRLHVAMRGRAGDRRFGGSTVLDLGPVIIDQPSTLAKPQFGFGPQQQDRVRQWTGGIAYEGHWSDVGEISAGLQYSDYRKRIDLPGGAGVQETDARPLLYNVTIAANLAPRLVVYAGAVTGLEESGIAPGNAANRNEALPAIRTRQFDAGLRYAITPDIKLVAGVFDISKPYFNLDANNRFDVLGEVINRGLELSVAGPATRDLSIVAGAVLLWPRVTGDAVAQGRIGNRPVGAIDQRIEISADWRPQALPGLSLDTKLAWRSAETATVSNRVAIPARANVDIGGRYRFRLAGNGAVLRVQVTNVFDVQGYDLRGAGAYGPIPGRLAQAYVTMDF
ncbi:MAG: TonB-dependent receptor [Alphaproteobacteria bacterium PA4]|nr:MAG: TonB-dependent receptor [Alphaproteobacteria bacterium PA4]